MTAVERGQTAPARPTPITFLATAHFVNDAYGTVYPALVPLLMVMLHWSVTVATLAGAVGWVGQAVQPFLGRLVDARPARYYVALALVVASLAVFSEPLARNYFLFLGLIVIGSAASSLFHPPALAIIGRDRRKARFMPVFLVSGNVGRAVGPLATSALILLAGHRISGAAVIALPGLVLAGLAWRTAPRLNATPHGVEAVSMGDALQGRHAPLLALLGLSGSRALVTSALIAMLPIWFHLQGHTDLQSGLYLAVLLFVGSLGNGMGGWLMERWPRWLILALSSAGAGLALLFFVPSTGPVALVLIGLVGLFSMATSSVTILMGQELLPKSRAMGSGIALGLSNSLGALLVAALSVVAGLYGIPAALYAAGAITLVTVPLSFLYGGWTKLETRFSAPTASGSI
jgi:FSR family fosmidomycin resistance protein-like MFS transporter